MDSLQLSYGIQAVVHGLLSLFWIVVVINGSAKSTIWHGLSLEQHLGNITSQIWWWQLNTQQHGDNICQCGVCAPSKSVHSTKKRKMLSTTVSTTITFPI